MSSKSSNKMVLDDSSELSDETGSGTSDSTSSSSSSDSDCNTNSSSTEDSDEVCARGTSNKPIKKLKVASGKNTVRTAEGLSKKSRSKKKTNHLVQKSLRGKKQPVVRRSVIDESSEEEEAFRKAGTSNGNSTGKHVSSKTCNSTLPPKNKHTDPKIVEEGLKLLKEGFSTKYVMAKFNLRLSTVASWRSFYLTKEEKDLLRRKSEAKGLGLQQVEDSRSYSKETIIKVCKLLKKGISVAEIKREFGMDRGTITRWREQYIPKEELPLDQKERRSKACKLLKQGKTAKSVAKQLGVSVVTVNDWNCKFVPESEVTFQTTGKNINKLLEACRQLDEGDSVRAVSERNGLSYETVSKWKWKYLSERIDKKEGRWNGYSLLRACEQLQRGVSADIVAKELNVSVNLVQKWEAENAVILRVEPEDGINYDKQFIRDVCIRLQQGECAEEIARELNINSAAVSKWKEKYCRGARPEPKDGTKYKKGTILEACELLRKGKTVRDVSKKLGLHNSLVLHWRMKYLGKRTSDLKLPKSHRYFQRQTVKYRQETRQKAYVLLRRGYLVKRVARKLKVSSTTVGRWKRLFLEEGSLKPRMSRWFDNKLVVSVCKRLQKGETVNDLSRELKVGRHSIYIWKHNYIIGNKIKGFLRSEQVRKRDITDGKLKSKCFVVLSRDPKIDELGRKAKIDCKSGHTGMNGCSTSSGSSLKPEGRCYPSTSAFAPLRKVYVPRKTKLLLVKMIEDDGVSVALLAKKLNINELTIRSWILNRKLLNK